MSDAGGPHSAFRRAEKHFKNRERTGRQRISRLPSLRLHGVVDLSRPEDDEVEAAGWWGDEGPIDRSGGRNLAQIMLDDGEIGWVLGAGCVLVPGCLSESEQLEEMERALCSYTLPPNPLSLSPHYDLPPDLFTLYATEADRFIQPLHATTSNSSTPPRTSSPAVIGRKTIETLPASKVGYEQILAVSKEWAGHKPSDKVKPATAERLMQELRWTNLGWVYNWTTKAYDFTCDEPIPFPEQLQRRCVDVVSRVPWKEVEGASPSVNHKLDGEAWNQDYAPDTGIVNFYQLKDTLMGHVDRAELDPTRPLVSISLGHACVFLLGGSTREVDPIPVILRSGDVLIMSGDSRAFYHGVPRILEGSLPEHFQALATDDLRRKACKRWIASGRININARQVFPPGFKRPSPS